MLFQQGRDSRVGAVNGRLRALSNVGGESAWMGLTLGDFEQTAGAPEVQGKNSDTEREENATYIDFISPTLPFLF